MEIFEEMKKTELNILNYTYIHTHTMRLPGDMIQFDCCTNEWKWCHV